MFHKFSASLGHSVAATKPESLDEYRKWLHEKHGIQIDLQEKNHYLAVAAAIQNQFSNGPFWQEFAFGRTLRNFDERYRLQHNDYPLVLDTDRPPSLLTKRFESFLSKSFRINVLQNRHWPGPPKWLGKDGWILPDNWFVRINDIVRTCFTVKYFDGVRFLVDRMSELARHHELWLETSFQARDEGYYAAHLYVSFEAEVVTRDWATQRIRPTVELQITTQLQEVIRQMLHRHYEHRRMLTAKPDDRWKWEHTSREFATNYLGHILHYLEGMIVEIRDRRDNPMEASNE